jgi:hypothetical protein
MNFSGFGVEFLRPVGWNQALKNHSICETRFSRNYL